jgi:hypothetical protein
VEGVVKWLTGVTAFAIAATIFSSRYSAGIFRSIGSGVGDIYRGAGAGARGR